VNRVIVLGGLGLFGRTIVDQLRQFNIAAHPASRGAAAEIRIDANDQRSIRSVLRAGDVVIDAAGPFHDRSTALVELAIDIGFDVVDINDNLRYAESVVALKSRIDAAGIRVLSSASSVSAVAAAIVRHSGIARPTRVTAFLAPASRHTANAGTALSLIQSVGQPVRILRDGELQSNIGWSEPRNFPMPSPIGPICGRLFESADSLYLPRIWPTLRDVAMYVDTNIPGMNSLLRKAANSRAVRSVLHRGVRIGTALARRLGASAGGIGYEIEDDTGRAVRYAISATRNSYLTAVAPAVLATRAIAEDHFREGGLVMPDRHVDAAELFAFLQAAGIEGREVGRNE
jgi:Saccharopine dehydrogenase NADP binding domain